MEFQLFDRMAVKIKLGNVDFGNLWTFGPLADPDQQNLTRFEVFNAD